MTCQPQIDALIHHQGIIFGVAFVRSSLRRMVQYASLVAPRRLASDALLVIRCWFKNWAVVLG